MFRSTCKQGEGRAGTEAWRRGTSLFVFRATRTSTTPHPVRDVAPVLLLMADGIANKPGCSLLAVRQRVGKGEGVRITISNELRALRILEQTMRYKE